MKKLFKKIGIIGLIIGVLSPFITLPKVNAANSNDGCDHYLNQYLFLSVSLGYEIEEFEGNGITNYTSFLYTFPDVSNANKTIEIVSVGEVPMDSEEEIQQYHSAYLDLLDAKTEEEMKTISKFGNWNEQVYSDYSTTTTLIHAYWSKKGSNDIDTTDWKATLKDFNTSNKFYNKTFQGALLEQDIISEGENDVFFTNVKGAKFTGTAFSAIRDNKLDTFEKYINYVIKDYNNNGISSNSLSLNYLTTLNNSKYFNTSITRTIDEDIIEDALFGRTFETGESKVFSLNYTTDINEVKDSYLAMKAFKENGDKCTITKDGTEQNVCYEVDANSNTKFINIGHSYYWPAMYNIEYKLCDTATSNTWTLTYNENVDDITTVKNMPSPKTVSNQVGDSITLSTTKPEREGYTFKGWCTKDKSVCKQPGESMPNSAKTNLTVYADWGETGAGNGDKDPLGVVSYVIGFAAVGVIAVGLYYVINKKNLFKQI